MQLDKMTQPGWEDAADYFCELDLKYGISKVMVQAIVQLETDGEAAAPATTTFGGIMKCLEIVPRISQMTQGTSRLGSSHMMVGLMKPQSNTSISGPNPTAERDTSTLLNAKPDGAVSIYPCI
jgi:hypothetical protein